MSLRAMAITKARAPHALRGLRARHLDNERGFDVINLARWFSWKSANMALHYAQSMEMARLFGFPKIP